MFNLVALDAFILYFFLFFVSLSLSFSFSFTCMIIFLSAWPGLEIATNTVTNVTSLFSLATEMFV